MDDYKPLTLICIDASGRPERVPSELWVREMEGYVFTGYAYSPGLGEVVFQLMDMPLREYTGLWGYPKSKFIPLSMVEEAVSDLLKELKLTTDEEN